MTMTALVIHSDTRRLRFACDALTMFRPGYRVSTCDNLEEAAEWVEALGPDMVVLEGAIAPANELEDWVGEHVSSHSAVLVLADGTDGLQIPRATIVPSTVNLPELMLHVRRIADDRAALSSAPGSRDEVRAS